MLLFSRPVQPGGRLLGAWVCYLSKHTPPYYDHYSTTVYSVAKCFWDFKVCTLSYEVSTKSRKFIMWVFAGIDYNDDRPVARCYTVWLILISKLLPSYHQHLLLLPPRRPLLTNRLRFPHHRLLLLTTRLRFPRPRLLSLKLDFSTRIKTTMTASFRLTTKRRNPRRFNLRRRLQRLFLPDRVDHLVRPWSDRTSIGKRNDHLLPNDLIDHPIPSHPIALASSLSAFCWSDRYRGPIYWDILRKYWSVLKGGLLEHLFLSFPSIWLQCLLWNLDSRFFWFFLVLFLDSSWTGFFLPLSFALFYIHLWYIRIIFMYTQHRRFALMYTLE